MLNCVWVVLLKCLKPPALTTSPIFASPAWAPSAGPLKAIDPGTETIVEAATYQVDYFTRTAQLKDTYELDKVSGSQYTDLLNCLRMCTYPLRFHGT